MKIIKLHPKEFEYWATLDWDSLMIYLEKKFGIKFKNEIKKRMQNTFQNEITRDKIQTEKLK